MNFMEKLGEPLIGEMLGRRKGPPSQPWGRPTKVILPQFWKEGRFGSWITLWPNLGLRSFPS